VKKAERKYKNNKVIQETKTEGNIVEQKKNRISTREGQKMKSYEG
jgi:hypothetical protein